MIVDSARPHFTLTCISTGGPATTVIWTRDSTTVTEGTATVLSDPVTAQYTHTLTVTGRAPGIYICTVANNKPSNDSAHILVDTDLDPSPVTIVPLNATSARISWTSHGSLSIHLQYTSSFNTTGLVITRHTSVLPSHTGSVDISLDDEFDGYEHSFTLNYILEYDITVPIIEANFSFGT